MTTGSDDAVRMLAEADLLLLLADWLKAPPQDSEEFGRDDLLLLAEHCRLDSDDAARLARLATNRARTPHEAWVAEHDRLFEGGVGCPPNETAYIRRDKGAILADIAGFYRAFGFNPGQGTGEKADHAVTEFQFFAILLVMAARAADAGRMEEEETTRRAMVHFAEDHLGAWIDIFCQRLEAVSRLDYFSELGETIFAAWRTLCANHGFSVQESEVTEFEQTVEEAPYECDGCTQV